MQIHEILLGRRRPILDVAHRELGIQNRVRARDDVAPTAPMDPTAKANPGPDIRQAQGSA